MLVLAYSTFEKTKLREGMLNKSPIPPGQGKFLPLLSQGATGLASQMKQVEENHFSSSRTWKGAWKIMSNVLELVKSPVWGRQITDLAGWQTDTSNMIKELGVQRR